MEKYIIQDDPEVSTPCPACDGPMTEVLRQRDWEWVCDNDACEMNCTDESPCTECANLDFEPQVSLIGIVSVILIVSFTISAVLFIVFEWLS